VPSGTMTVYGTVAFRDESGRFLAAVDAGTTGAVQALASGGAATARGAAPTRTGRLRASIRFIMLGAFHAAFGSWGVHYALFQEEGTGPGRPQGGYNIATHFIAAGRAYVRSAAPGVFRAFLP
jgi:hypothetical protein